MYYIWRESDCRAEKVKFRFGPLRRGLSKQRWDSFIPPRKGGVEITRGFCLAEVTCVAGEKAGASDYQSLESTSQLYRVTYLQKLAALFQVQSQLDRNRCNATKR